MVAPSRFHRTSTPFSLISIAVSSIPGSKRRPHLEDNVRALDVRLSDEDLARIDRILPPGAAAGERYDDSQMQALNG